MTGAGLAQQKFSALFGWLLLEWGVSVDVVWLRGLSWSSWELRMNAWNLDFYFETLIWFRTFCALNSFVKMDSECDFVCLYLFVCSGSEWEFEEDPLAEEDRFYYWLCVGWVHLHVYRFDVCELEKLGCTLSPYSSLSFNSAWMCMRWALRELWCVMWLWMWMCMCMDFESSKELDSKGVLNYVGGTPGYKELGDGWSCDTTFA